MDDPNFPPHLQIIPSESDFRDSETFGVNAQRSAIQKYGIAGRVWEAAYALMAYLEPQAPGIEFDPPSPFPSRRQRSRSLSTPPASDRSDSNLNPNEQARPSSPEPTPYSDLDAEYAPKPFTILELGSGTGLTIAKLAEIVRDASHPRIGTDDILIATDLDNVCPLLEQNLSCAAKTFSTVNQHSLRILIRPLEWGIHDHTLRIFNELGSRRLTHIVCSDLVYFPHLLAPLLRTLIHLTSVPPSSSQPRIIISYRIRSLPKEIPFWSAFGLWFSYEPVLYRPHHQCPSGSLRENANDERNGPPCNAHSNGDPEAKWARYHASSSTYIFIARRKSVSLAWTVPEGDKDLLEGVGADGNQRQKADDAFELMLLMDLLNNED